MAIKNEKLKQPDRAKIQRGFFKIEAREIPGVGLSVDAKGCLGDTSYLALAARLVGVVSRNMRPTDDHDRIIELARAMTLLNHLAGVNEEASYGVDRSAREDYEPAPVEPIGHA